MLGFGDQKSDKEDKNSFLLVVGDASAFIQSRIAFSQTPHRSFHHVSRSTSVVRAQPSNFKSSSFVSLWFPASLPSSRPLPAHTCFPFCDFQPSVLHFDLLFGPGSGALQVHISYALSFPAAIPNPLTSLAPSSSIHPTTRHFAPRQFQTTTRCFPQPIHTPPALYA